MMMAVEANHRGTRAWWRSFNSIPTFFSLLLSHHIILHPVHSQGTPTQSTPARTTPTWTPIPAVAAAYARSWTRLYVQGGTTITGNTVNSQMNQLFALDLTQPWPAETPTWIRLSSDGPVSTLHSAVVSLDQKRLLVTGTKGSFGDIYDIEDDTWVSSSVLTSNPSRAEVKPIQDLETGLVYFAGGYGLDKNDTTIPVYNFTADAMIPPPLLTIPSGFMTDRSFYSGVYVKPRKSILYFGGFSNDNKTSPSPGVITEFIPSNRTWSKLVSCECHNWRKETHVSSG